jgi:hypothetical protein
MCKTPLLPTLGVVLIASVAQGQLIVGNDQGGLKTIWNVDPASGAAAPLYSSSALEAETWGMAYDGATNTLYWNSGSTLYSSPFGAALTPTNLGTMTFNAMSVNFVGLGFHNGKLYGTRNISTEAVYEIDPVTLVAKQVYVYPSAFDFGGLDFDATNGLMYALSDTAPAGSVAGLYEIDSADQSQTFKAPYPAGEFDIDGLAVHNGIAYYITDGPNTEQPSFYKYDVATGQLLGTIPSPFTGSGIFCAATWAPEPSSLVLLTLLGATVLRRR